MLCIRSEHTQPYLNLAAEEYLLRLPAGPDVFMMWESTESVVVGKHQNTLAEINYPFVKEQNILVARRLTGGGTVFHAPGNLNFTFIRTGAAGKLIDFGGFIEPVMLFLKEYGLRPEKGSKHEILVNGMKVSGNAEHVYKNRVLHHGTLLYRADLSRLQQAIQVIPGRYTDKAVQSNRSQVANLSDLIPNAPALAEFADDFFNFVCRSGKGKPYRLTPAEIHSIETLAGEKYSRREWIYGYSPAYKFNNPCRVKGVPAIIELDVEKGTITGCSIHSPALSPSLSASLNRSLTGLPHREDEVLAVFMAHSEDLPIGTSAAEWAGQFF